MKVFSPSLIPSKTTRNISLLFSICVFLSGCGTKGVPSVQRVDSSVDQARWASPQLDSLNALSIETLRSRRYLSKLQIETELGSASAPNSYTRFFSADGSAVYGTYLAAYLSDGLRVYTRLDIPAGPVPARGFPVVIFVHGWVGEEAAPAYDFGYKPDSAMSEVLDAYVDAGFVVLTPGLRGHGAVNGVTAEGLEFLSAWDNRSYLSPIFYAIDVLNLLEGVQSLAEIDWRAHSYSEADNFTVDLSRINIAGHSQGGDAVLTALAIAGEGSRVNNRVMHYHCLSGIVFAELVADILDIGYASAITLIHVVKCTAQRSLHRRQFPHILLPGPFCALDSFYPICRIGKNKIVIHSPVRTDRSTIPGPIS